MVGGASGAHGAIAASLVALESSSVRENVTHQCKSVIKIDSSTQLKHFFYNVLCISDVILSGYRLLKFLSCIILRNEWHLCFNYVS